MSNFVLALAAAAAVEALFVALGVGGDALLDEEADSFDRRPLNEGENVADGEVVLDAVEEKASSFNSCKVDEIEDIVAADGGDRMERSISDEDLIAYDAS